MPEQTQKIVQADIASSKHMGARKDINIRKAFPNSPIYTEELTDSERKEKFKELALDGTVLNGLGINSFNIIRYITNLIRLKFF